MQPNPLVQIPPPPVGYWERLGDAATRVGVSPDLLRAELAVGRCGIRVARIGKRGLVHCASADVDRYARRLAAGEMS